MMMNHFYVIGYSWQMYYCINKLYSKVLLVDVLIDDAYRSRRNKTFPFTSKHERPREKKGGFQFFRKQ